MYSSQHVGDLSGVTWYTIGRTPGILRMKTASMKLLIFLANPWVDYKNTVECLSMIIIIIIIHVLWCVKLIHSSD